MRRVHDPHAGLPFVDEDGAQRHGEQQGALNAPLLNKTMRFGLRLGSAAAAAAAAAAIAAAQLRAGQEHRHLFIAARAKGHHSEPAAHQGAHASDGGLDEGEGDGARVRGARGGGLGAQVHVAEAGEGEALVLQPVIGASVLVLAPIFALARALLALAIVLGAGLRVHGSARLLLLHRPPLMLRLG
jgi:hypothetical protein